MRKEGIPVLNMLSPQEQKLFDLLLTDNTMKEIAALMELAPTTVDTYQRNIFKKLGVNSRIGLILQYYREILEDMRRTKGLKT